MILSVLDHRNAEGMGKTFGISMGQGGGTSSWVHNSLQPGFVCFRSKNKKTLHEITEVLQLRATPMLRSEPKGFVNVDTRFIYCKHFASVHLLYRVLCD